MKSKLHKHESYTWEERRHETKSVLGWEKVLLLVESCSCGMRRIVVHNSGVNRNRALTPWMTKQALEASKEYRHYLEGSLLSHLEFKRIQEKRTQRKQHKTRVDRRVRRENRKR